MAVEVKLPRLGQGMESGTIVRWLKAEGEAVSKGEALYELDTDKVTQEVRPRPLASSGSSSPKVRSPSARPWRSSEPRARRSRFHRLAAAKPRKSLLRTRP
jgi:hypothetical protein